MALTFAVSEDASRELLHAACELATLPAVAKLTPSKHMKLGVREGVREGVGVVGVVGQIAKKSGKTMLDKPRAIVVVYKVTRTAVPRPE